MGLQGTAIQGCRPRFLQKLFEIFPRRNGNSSRNRSNDSEFGDGSNNLTGTRSGRSCDAWHSRDARHGTSSGRSCDAWHSRDRAVREQLPEVHSQLEPAEDEEAYISSTRPQPDERDSTSPLPQSFREDDISAPSAHHGDSEVTLPSRLVRQDAELSSKHPPSIRGDTAFPVPTPDEDRTEATISPVPGLEEVATHGTVETRDTVPAPEEVATHGIVETGAVREQLPEVHSQLEPAEDEEACISPKLRCSPHPDADSLSRKGLTPPLPSTPVRELLPRKPLSTDEGVIPTYKQLVASREQSYQNTSSSRPPGQQYRHISAAEPPIPRKTMYGAVGVTGLRSQAVHDSRTQSQLVTGTGPRSQPVQDSKIAMRKKGRWELFGEHVDPNVVCLRHAFAAEMRLESNANARETCNPLSRCRTVFDKWRTAIFHNVACSTIRDLKATEPRTAYPYVSAGRGSQRSGVLLEILRRTDPHCQRWRLLRRLDCVLQRTRNGKVSVLLCVAGDGIHELDEEGVRGAAVLPAVGLATLPNSYRKFCSNPVELLCSLSADFVLVESLNVFQNPPNKMCESFAAVFKRDMASVSRLVEHVKTYQSAERSQSEGIHPNGDAYNFIRTLRHNNYLNNMQADVPEAVLTKVLSWKRDDGRPQLDRFLIIEGVPGCGKTHTLVYTVATILKHFHPEVMHHDPGYHQIRQLGLQMLLVTKTNKALDVICKRLRTLDIPDDGEAEGYRNIALPFYCSRSGRYMSQNPEPEAERKRQRGVEPSSCPDILSTFGNLQKLLHEMKDSVTRGKHESAWVRHVLEILKVLIIDEGSQTCKDDLSLFLFLCPHFRGIIVIFCDPHQMGPVVLSSVEEVRRYLSRSMFEELKCPESGYIVPHVSMNIQYRMRKEIMDLANDVTYNNRMQYGADPADNYLPEIYRVPQKYNPSFPFSFAVSPVVWLSSSFCPEDMFRCTGLMNIDECKLACACIQVLTGGKLPSTSQENIVFLSAYNRQCALMKWIADNLNMRIRISSVTTFQGEEGDVILFSLVRSMGANVGISEDETLVTVAITRAKYSLIFLGDIRHLATKGAEPNIWKRIWNSIETRRAHHRRGSDILALTGLPLLDRACTLLARYEVPV